MNYCVIRMHISMYVYLSVYIDIYRYIQDSQKGVKSKRMYRYMYTYMLYPYVYLYICTIIFIAICKLFQIIYILKYLDFATSI
jgi:hypothetical protein